MTRDRSDDAIAPTQVSANDATMRSDAGGRASPDDLTLPAPAATGAVGRFQAGARLGRYELVGLLGKGGMGEVYAAHDPQLDRFVAVKVLLAEIRSEAASARLVREAQSLARLSHPNVVAVYDAGEDGGHVYLAMQLVEGQTLLTYLREKQPGWAETVALFVEAGKGLAAAHAAGMIHRDFKPSNVLVDRAGKVAVTDFGVARAAAGGQAEGPAPDLSNPALASISSRSRSSRPSYDANLTRVGELVGTPIYMSPEQFTGQATTIATDQFAFCIALWEALFDRHPYFDGSAEATVLAYASAVQEGALILPKKTVVPRRVLNALVRGLDRDPAKRWPTMDALLAELAPPPAVKRWPLAVAGAVIVLGGGGVAAFLGLRDDTPPLCPVRPAERLAVVWGPAQADALTKGFMATGRPYAEKVATDVRASLDSYGAQWIQAATAACSAEKAEREVRDQARRRLACLGRAHAALSGTVGQYTGAVVPTAVDAAFTTVDKLPPIADCVGDRTPLAPPAIEARLAAIQPRLEQLAVLSRTGQYKRASEALVELQRDTVDLPWEPFQARLAFLVAEHESRALSRPPDPVALAAIARRLAKAGDRRTELEAWNDLMHYVKEPAQLDEAVTAASAAASALGGGRQAMLVGINHGRGLVRLRRYPEAVALCKDAMTAANAAGWVVGEMQASDCLVEANVPLGRYGDLEAIVERNLALKTQLISPDHPAVADLLLVRAEILENQGKLSEAEATIMRALEIRKRAYGEKDLRVGAALREVAGVIAAAKDYDRAIETAEQALVIIGEAQPPDDAELLEVHRDLGMLAMEKDDHAGVRTHFELALASADRLAGPESLQTAFLLLMYGQYQTAWDLDAGIATLKRTITLFEKHQDARVPVVRAALAAMLINHDRFAEARAILEETVDKVDAVNTPPLLLGQLYQAYTSALYKTKADKDKTYAAAIKAGDYFAKAGRNDLREHMNDYIDDRKLKPKPRKDKKKRDR
jgi:tetratricopeptide (TPR) repeat protein